MHTRKYLIKTYGCQMNIHESEKIAGILKEMNFCKEAESEEDADIIVFNTCCIRDGAEQKIFSHIGALKKLKKKNPKLIICVTGCLAQADGKIDDIEIKFPFVDIAIGTYNLSYFGDYLMRFLEDGIPTYDVWPEDLRLHKKVTPLRSQGTNAWVNISYGCDNYCTYCIVPYVRGRERSRSVQDIVDEVRCLAEGGYRYITLLGQNVNSYGNDIDDPDVNFATLLKKVSEIEGDFKIRFMTNHPKDLTDDVIEEVATNDKICKVIHLPVQSGNNRILKLMNRKYTREKYLEIIDKIRKRIPNCTITTDIIVGFPTETDEEYMDTYNLVKEVRFDGIFAFKYSKRTGTPAEKMDGQVPELVKRQRVNDLLALERSIIRQDLRKMVRQKLDAVFDYSDAEKNESYFKLDNNKTVTVPYSEYYNTDSFHKIKIMKAVNNRIYGLIRD